MRRMPSVLGLSFAVAGAASAQTVTVTTASDTVDINWSVATIDDLPGPDGKVSLSEALIACNNTPGHQTIGFAIPQSEWILQFAFPGRAVLTSGTGYFLHAFDEVTIDGTTQTAYTGDTNPDGWEVVLYGAELGLNAANCTLIGFDSSSVSVSGADCLVEGNTGTMNISLFQGHGSLIQGNKGGTIKIDRSNDVVVVGNTVNRVRVLGFGPAQLATNNRIGGPNPEDRNYLLGYGTWNSEGMPAGAAIQLFDSSGTLIENNSIGTTPDGMAQGNLACTMGIDFEGQNHDTVIRGNRIAGILGHGQGPHHAGQLFGWAIALGGSGSGVTIVGNTIGLDANGDPMLGSVVGVDVGDAWYCTLSDITIGGLAAGEGNVIAGHLFNGVTVEQNMPQVRISGNSIHANGWLGIDLIPTSYGYGPSANDPLDSDGGGNGLQNYPVLDEAARQGAGLHLLGSLNSAPSIAYTIEYFASPLCDDSGYGQGQVFLGSSSVATDQSGNAAIEVLLDAAIEAGWVVAATATREPEGATSEFGPCLVVTSASLIGDLDGDGLVGPGDLAFLLGAWGSCASCPQDLDDDGIVGGSDLAILLGNWS